MGSHPVNVPQLNVERIGSNCKNKYFKFVGHHLDEFLTWEHQINHVHGKLASGNYAIARTKFILPQNIKLTLYNSLFRSHLEFGILAWGGVPPAKLKGIINLQKKCVRNVSGKKYRSHTDPIFSSLNLLKFPDIFNYNCTLFMHKIILGTQPESFAGMFAPLGTGPSSRTTNFQTLIAKNKFSNQFPSIFLPRIWNSNKLEHKKVHTQGPCTKKFIHGKLKKSVYNSMIAEYNPNVHCHDPECPDCR